MLHFCVNFFAGRYIFYDGNRRYFCFLDSLFPISFEFNHSLTTAIYSRVVNILVLQAFRTLITKKTKISRTKTFFV
jgi:hypothetical protein